MPQHYTRSTVSAAAWCPACQKQTQHRIDDRRIGPCLQCVKQLEIRRDEYEERAGIKEFCGNMPRVQAEQEAREEVYGTVAPTSQKGLF